jgi:hypothetical protein
MKNSLQWRTSINFSRSVEWIDLTVPGRQLARFYVIMAVVPGTLEQGGSMKVL